MAWVAVTISVALLEYFFFVMAVGRARGRLKIAAPAVTGHPDFERVYRVQMNTLELLIIFVPAILLFANYVSAAVAAGLGALFIIGRALYYAGYTRAANKRGIGAGISFLAALVLLVGGLIGAVLTAVRA